MIIQRKVYPQFDSCVGKIGWRRDRLPTLISLGFPGGSAGKESAHNEGDLGSIPGLGRFPGEGKDYLLQYSGLENSTVKSMQSQSQIRLSDFYFHFHLTPKVLPPCLFHQSTLPIYISEFSKPLIFSLKFIFFLFLLQDTGNSSLPDKLIIANA